MALPSGTDVETLGANASGGMTIGASASELVSFHNATPVAQAAFVATQARVAVTGGVGFSTTAEFSLNQVMLNAILTILRDKGLMAAS